MRKLLIGLLCLGGLQAQTTTRYYLMPAVVDSALHLRHAKYMYPSPGAPNNGKAMFLGDSDFALVSSRVTAAEHAAIVANSDVIALPVDLTATMNGATLTTAKNNLEAIGVPMDDVTGPITFRQFLRRVAERFQVAQTLAGMKVGRLLTQANLDRQFSTLPANAQTKIETILGGGQIAPTTTVRQLLKTLAATKVERIDFAGGLE